MEDKDLFQEEFNFFGYQAGYANNLSDKKIDNESDIKIFNSTIELFMTAALVGCYFRKKVKKEKSSKENKNERTIFAEQFHNHYNDLLFIYRLTMLCNDIVDDDIERINNAFRNYRESKNVELFEEYVMGGLSILYDNFFPVDKKLNDFEDYVDNLLAFLSEIQENDVKDDDEDEDVLFD